MRDRAALFWTLAFPLDLHLHVRLHLPGRRQPRLTIAWVDEDGSAASAAAARRRSPRADGVDARPTPTATRPRPPMKDGEVDAVIVVPAGYGDALAAAAAGTGAPATLTIVHRPVATSSSPASVYQAVGSVLGVVNLGGRPPLVAAAARDDPDREPQRSSATSCRACSGMSVMQVGIFAAIPLVADREKLILKRLAATPLRRWQLVGSNVLMRLLIALVQAVIIVGVGVAGVRRRDHRHPARWSAAFVVLGARGVPGARLRHRLVRQDRGRGQRDDPGRPVPDDVPVGRRSSRSTRCRRSCRSSPGSSR